jgi:hypothetical protein
MHVLKYSYKIKTLDDETVTNSLFRSKNRWNRISGSIDDVPAKVFL